MSNATVSIRLLDGTWITPPKVSSVKFVKTAPGGCASASFIIEEADWIDKLGPQCPVIISDARTSTTLWSGYVKDDGRTREGARLTLTVDVSGSAQLLTENQEWLPYAVQDLGQWVSDTSATTNKTTGQSGSGTLPWHSTISALIMSMPQGQINPLDCLRMTYQGFANSTMTLGGLSASVESGVTQGGSAQHPADWWFRVYWGDPAWGRTPIALASTDIGYEHDFTVVTGSGSSTPAGQQQLELEWKFAGVNGQANGYTSSSDTLWCGVWNVVVYGQACDRHGTPWPFDPTTYGGWLPHHIVEDVMGRLCGQWVHMDSSISSVAQDSMLLIDQMDFSGSSGPADAQTVLEALISLLPDHYYSVGPMQPNGRVPLSWQSWPTEPTLQAPAWNVVYDANGSVQDLCNEVLGIYTDAAGKTQTVTATADPNVFPDVRSLDRTRQTVVSLDNTIGSATAAQTVVNEWLYQVASLPKGATATISEPVMNLGSGSPVRPSMLEPGHLMLVPETGDTLRVNEVEWDADTDTATIKLASPTYTLEQLIAGLGQRHLRKGLRS